MTKLKRIQWNDFLFVISLTILTYLWAVLFYRMTINYDDQYPSDFDAYISMGNHAGDYAPRLITYVYGFLYGLRGDTVWPAVFSALVCTAVVVTGFLLISSYVKRDGITSGRSVRQLAAICLIFTGSIYIPGVHEFFYKNCWTTFAWQSPTHQAMALFSLIAVLFFLKLFDTYETRFNVGLWIGFMISLTLSGATKPSFILTFAPTLVILFLIEVFTAPRGRKFSRFWRLILIGCAFLPSGLYVLYMKSRIYSSETATNSIAVGATHSLLDPVVIIQFGLCMAFPVVVFLFNLKKFRLMQFKAPLVNAIIGVLQWAYIAEEGSRAGHGNFSWGRKFGMYLLFLCSYAMAIENLNDKSFLQRAPFLRKCYFVLIGILFLAHLFSQLLYFYLVMTGHGFYI